MTDDDDRIKPDFLINFPLSGNTKRALRKAVEAADRLGSTRAKCRRKLPADNGWPPMKVNKWWAVQVKWNNRFSKEIQRDRERGCRDGRPAYIKVEK